LHSKIDSNLPQNIKVEEMKTKWIFGLIITLLIVLTAFMVNKKDHNDKPAKKERPHLKVDAFIAKPSMLIDEISVSGSIMAFEEVELKNEVAGRVVYINLPEGRFVKKGTLLVKLYDDDLQAGLNKLQTQLAIQEQLYKRQAELLKVNGISQNDFDQTGLQLNSIKADIEVQKVLIRKTEVLAPFDGVIGLRQISVGAQITPSTPLATIREVNRLKLDFSVPEKYSAEVKPGMKVSFSQYKAEKTYQATVFATEEGIDESTRNLKVRALIDSHSNDLIPGAFISVSLIMGENDHALMIPTQAIIPSGENKNVIVAQKGKAHMTQVKTGIRKAAQIEITDGLQPGDTIVISGILFLKEGDRLFYSTVKSGSL
jgi:membrane fusion protein, multidrug efflux system